MTAAPVAIRLLVGLGNPGAEYARTRHNVGFWFVDELVRRGGLTLRPERRFRGQVGELPVAGGEPCRLLKPDTFMNRSGEAVGALARFFRIAPEEILIVHDDLDLPVGVVRLKVGGGHGGHNGLRDLHAHLGTGAYARLRFGIAHPGDPGEVLDHVLGAPSAADRNAIEAALDRAIGVLPLVLEGQAGRAMNALHRDPATSPPR